MAGVTDGLAGQLDIFDTTRFRRARRADHVSSHAAANAMTHSGRAKAQAAAVLEALRRFPMSTSAELAQSAGLDRYLVARRLPELSDVNLVDVFAPSNITVPCAISRKRVCRWRARD